MMEENTIIPTAKFIFQLAINCTQLQAMKLTIDGISLNATFYPSKLSAASITFEHEGSNYASKLFLRENLDWLQVFDYLNEQTDQISLDNMELLIPSELNQQKQSSNLRVMTFKEYSHN